jgi:thymidylate kinase
LLIGVGGLSGAGKNYCVNVLKDMLTEQGKTLKLYAFGDKVKELCAHVTNTNIHLWYEDELKDVDCPLLAFIYCNDAEFFEYTQKSRDACKPRSMRWWMQNYSDWLKIVYNHPNVFVDHIVNELEWDKKDSQPDVQIVTDVRYQSELEAVKKLGGHCVYIYNPEMKLLDKHYHNSEQMVKEDFDSVILNVKHKTSLEAIKGQWEEIIDG